MLNKELKIILPYINLTYYCIDNCVHVIPILPTILCKLGDIEWETIKSSSFYYIVFEITVTINKNENISKNASTGLTFSHRPTRCSVGRFHRQNEINIETEPNRPDGLYRVAKKIRISFTYITCIYKCRYTYLLLWLCVYKYI